MKHVAVDPELCIGSSECVRLLPEAFRIDPQRGVSVPTAGAPSADPALLAAAVRNCPMSAISVEDEGA
jgi:ferredoxin